MHLHIWKSCVVFGGQWAIPLCSPLLFWSLMCSACAFLTQQVQKYEVLKPTLSFPYYLLSGIKHFLFDLAPCFFSEPVGHCAQCVTLSLVKGAECVCTHRRVWVRENGCVFNLDSVCMVHSCLVACVVVCLCASAQILYTWSAKTREQPIWGSPPLLLSALLSSSLLPSAHLMLVLFLISPVIAPPVNIFTPLLKSSRIRCANVPSSPYLVALFHVKHWMLIS